MSGPAYRAFGTQMVQQFFLQYAASLYVKASIYRLVGHLLVYVSWKATFEPAGNLFWRPLAAQLHRYCVALLR
ncbi:hypothetical protein PsAD26_04745 [Pseudovibrio sp. Ad26]|nr:hypothetical protein PsAD26_04745 [Pseudovibrio sp. Ad26]